LQFPILEHPEKLFALFVGQDPGVDFVTFTPPALEGGVDVPISFPIGPVLLTLGFGLHLKGQLQFGYDTRGIEEFITSKNPADLFNGFYVGQVKDVPAFQITSNISIGATIPFPVTLEPEGEIVANVNFDLHGIDPKVG